MRIALDTMGGDLGPRPAVEGALAAVRNYNIEVLLVGRERHLKRLLDATGVDDRRLTVVDAPEVVTMTDLPRESLRKKKSSLAIAAQLVRDGQADALVSAGNTGAVLAHTQLTWRNLPGIKKPAIGALLPAHGGRVVVIDSGATVDCKPHHLVNFAAMGACYVREILGRTNPRIGLLSNGEEDIKGNDLTLSTAALLRKTRLNFLGNVEGRDIFSGDVDVVVCDGFVGNVVLKTAEGTAKFCFESLKREAMKSWMTQLGGLLLRPAVKAIRKRTDYEETGGAPLLGVNGIAIILHGSSDGRTFANALRVSREAIACRLTTRLKEWLDETGNALQMAGVAEPLGPTPVEAELA